MRYLLVLLLSGCQVTIARLPSPDAPPSVIAEHEKALRVLVEDYNARLKAQEK